MNSIIYWWYSKLITLWSWYWIILSLSPLSNIDEDFELVPNPKSADKSNFSPLPNKLRTPTDNEPFNCDNDWTSWDALIVAVKRFFSFIDKSQLGSIDYLYQYQWLNLLYQLNLTHLLVSKYIISKIMFYLRWKKIEISNKYKHWFHQIFDLNNLRYYLILFGVVTFNSFEIKSYFVVLFPLSDSSQSDTFIFHLFEIHKLLHLNWSFHLKFE